MPDDVEVADDSWRAALSESYDKAVASETAAESPAAAPESAAPAEATEAPSSTESTQDGRERDEKGRFKPGAAAKGNEAPRPTSSGAQAGAVIGAPPTAAPAAPPAPISEIKPPGGWKPAAREAFLKAPPEVQQEVLRRERELSTLTARAQKEGEVAESFRQAISPYEAQIRQTGMQPVQYVGNLLQTAHALAYGHPQQKADIVATLAMQFAVSPQDLDAALVARMNGQPAQQRQAPPPVDEEAILRRVEERAQAAADERFAAIELEKARPELEYFDDLAEDMAKVIDSGLATNYQEAHALALQLPKNHETLALVKQKEAAKSAANAQASTQRARAAASSVRSTPGSAGGSAVQGDDWRSHLEAAWDKAATR